MPPIRFGIVGAGAIAHVSAKSIRSHDGAEIAAAHDPNRSRLEALCDEFAIGRAHDSVDDLMADDALDAIYVAVPNKFHAPLAIQALRSGKHVILDKPFAMDLGEAREVVAAAEESGKVFTLGMNQRFAEGSQKIRTLVERGTFGEIYHAKCYWYRRKGIPRLGTWFGSKAMAGGGCLLDIGVHMLDLCLYTIGNYEPVAVSGATYTQFGNRGLGEGGWGRSDRDKDLVFDVEDLATGLIKFANGATVQLDVTWACHMEDPGSHDVRIYGTEAGAGLFPARVFRQDPIREGYDVIDDVAAELKFPHKDRFHNFINHLRGDEELCCTIEQALTVQKILDGIYESAATGREVAIEQG